MNIISHSGTLSLQVSSTFFLFGSLCVCMWGGGGAAIILACVGFGITTTALLEETHRTSSRTSRQTQTLQHILHQRQAAALGTS
jgi:hypothetical protein